MGLGKVTLENINIANDLASTSKLEEINKDRKTYPSDFIKGCGFLSLRQYGVLRTVLLIKTKITTVLSECIIR